MLHIYHLLKTFARKRLYLVISVLTIFSAIAYLTFFAILGKKFSTLSDTEHRSNLVRMVDLANNLCAPTVEDFEHGKISRTDAVNHIAELIRHMNYYDPYGRNYIFLISYDATIYVHSDHPHGHGESSAHELDICIKPISPQLIDTARNNAGGGFVEYEFLPPGYKERLIKTSFVKGIPSLEILIGTGMYKDIALAGQESLLQIAEIGSIIILAMILIPLIIILRLLKQRNAELTEMQIKFHTLFFNSVQQITLLDSNGVILELNRKALEFDGSGRDKIIGKYFPDTKAWSYSDSERTHLITALSRAAEGESISYEIIFSFPEKEPYYIDFTLTPVFSHGVVKYIIAEGRDITNLRKIEQDLRRSEERFRLAADGSNDALWDIDLLTGHAFFSDRWDELTGYRGDEFSNAREMFEKAVHPTDFEELIEKFKAFTSGTTPSWFSNEFRIVTKSGRIRWILIRGKLLIDDEGKAYRVAGSITDITENKQKENRITELAYYDKVTSLPNRYFLQDILGEQLSSEVSGTLFLVNVNNLNAINDTFGHYYGDRILLTAAESIKGAVTNPIVIARISGSTFIVATYASSSNYSKTAEAILQTLHKPVEIEGLKIRASINIGIAFFPENGKTVSDLLRNADAAMYHARLQARDSYTVFDRRITEELAEKVTLENMLHDAIAHDEFVLHYQPQIELSSGRLAGFEALIRWKSPKGFISPGAFINIAEESGLIIPIGNTVIRKASEFIYILSAKGYTDVTVSVNVSTLQLMQTDFIETVSAIINKVGINPQQLGIEITESSLMQSNESNVEKLFHLKEKGISVHLDDFGTGYSSLNYLQQLPIDTLKIDKSFIDKIENNEKSRKLATSIINIAHQIGIDVVAEGVENDKQLSLLAGDNCDIIQGYIFSKPLQDIEAISYLEKNRIKK